MKRTGAALMLCLPGLAQAIEFEDLMAPSGYAEMRSSYSQIEGTPWTTQQRRLCAVIPTYNEPASALHRTLNT